MDGGSMDDGSMDDESTNERVVTNAARSAEEFAKRWFDAGLLSAEQRDAVLAFERTTVAVGARRLTLVAEIATYLGAVIAFAGGAAVVAPNWERIGFVGQSMVGLAIAVVGFLAGRLIVRFGEPGADRVGWFLWAVGTGGVALAGAAAVHAAEPRDGSWYPLVIGVVVAVVSGALWRNLDRPLQLVTTGLGAILATVGAAELFDADTWVLGPVIWSGAVSVGGAAAVGRVQPRSEALAMAAVGAMIGSFVLMDANERLAAILAVVTAAGIVAFAMADRSIPLIGIGVLAFFVATTSLMQIVLHGMVQRLAAAAVGLVVVVIVAIRAQRLAQPRPG
jgi:hypothetical protein